MQDEKYLLLSSLLVARSDHDWHRPISLWSRSSVYPVLRCQKRPENLVGRFWTGKLDPKSSHHIHVLCPCLQRNAKFILKYFKLGSLNTLDFYIFSWVVSQWLQTLHLLHNLAVRAKTSRDTQFNCLFQSDQGKYLEQENTETDDYSFCWEKTDLNTLFHLQELWYWSSYWGVVILWLVLILFWERWRCGEVFGELFIQLLALMKIVLWNNQHDQDYNQCL